LGVSVDRISNPVIMLIQIPCGYDLWCYACLHKGYNTCGGDGGNKEARYGGIIMLSPITIQNLLGTTISLSLPLVFQAAGGHIVKSKLSIIK